MMLSVCIVMQVEVIDQKCRSIGGRAGAAEASATSNKII